MAGSEVTTDSKGASDITGFGRQRLHKIRKDPTLGFPEPIVVGRSIRWLVSDLMKWLQAMKLSDSELLARRNRSALRPARATLAMPASTRRSFFLQKMPLPTAAQIDEANRVAFAKPLLPGQTRVGRMVKTIEGEVVWRYRVIGKPQENAVPTFRPVVKVSRRRTSRDIAPDRLGANKVAACGLTDLSSLPIPAQGKPKPGQLSLFEMKADYESGKTLDVMCKTYRMGKGRLLKLLQAAGTEMRPPGRASKQQGC
jgi:predicted DNA-binding transcriptional regulator AlpA